jgi:transposase
LIHQSCQQYPHFNRSLSWLKLSPKSSELAQLINSILGWKASSPVEIPDLISFVTGLRRDYDTMKAGSSLVWNNGQLEGQVNRLKSIKRQMYVRAKSDLVRLRVLHP